MAEQAIGDVSDTAFWVAHYRAVETLRPDALFQDPLASRLVGERGRKIAAAMPGGNMTAWSVVMRTCIIDAFIGDLLKQGAELVVNLGAGLDTRPYRLELPATLQWIEVDYPHIIALKNERLGSETPRCRLERLQCDLADRPARQKLFAELAKRAQRIVVLTEGVVPYLSNDAAAQLAEDLHAQPTFRHWIIDYIDIEIRKMLRTRNKRAQKNAPFLFEPDDWFKFFERHGWRAAKERGYSEEAAKRRRRPPVPWWMILRFMFMSRSTRRRMQRSSGGYAIFEPIQ